MTDLIAAVADFIRDRRIVLLGRPLSQYARTVAALREMGAQPPLVLANGTGHGETPGGLAAHAIVNLGDGGFTATARATDRFLRHPSPTARRALECYDPDHKAIVLVDSNVSSDRLDGRIVADGRPPEWAALEDAPAVDALWLAVDASPLPGEIVRYEPAELAAAHERRDLGTGTLWFGDIAAGPRLSWEQACLVRDSGDAAEAIARLAECRWVRVLTNVSGVPAAISGFVLRNGVVVLPATEELVLTGPSRTQLRFAGSSTCYNPGPASAEMKRLARTVGARLANEHGFRGAFVVSGIVRGASFLPVDLLTRFAAPHQLMNRSTPELPWPLLHAAVVSGHDLGYSAADVELLLATAVRAQPGAFATLDMPSAGTPDARVRWLIRDVEGLREAEPGQPSDGCLVRDESAPRGTVSMLAGSGLLPESGLMAGLASAAFALSDRIWGTRLGPLAPLAR